MIKTCSLKELAKYSSDYNFMIVRSYKYPVSGVMHLPHLSPSPSLFSYYLSNKNNPDWFDTYETEFNLELNSDEKHNGIKYLDKLIKEGKTITLICYCWDVATCHRRLVGEYLQKLGYDVEIH